MNINELMAFVEVVESGSMTLAAGRLHRVQSSISQRIKRLEEQLGVTLFDRGNGLVPTAEGQLLYDYGKRIVCLIEECEWRFRRGLARDVLRLGVIECMPAPIIDRIMDVNDADGVELNIVVGNTMSLIHSLNNDELDAVIVGAGFAGADHVRVPLFSDKLVLVTERSAAKIDSIADLNDSAFLLRSKKSASFRNLEILFLEGCIVPRRVVECGSYPILFMNVKKGNGVSLVLNSSVSGGLRDEIRVHEIQGRFSKFDVELLYRRTVSHASMTFFRQTVVDALASRAP
ncbi:LysR family transcriptional regulator [Rhodopseudomonas sp. BR0M22]|uniref:LysR family transcriptional regulator n=1 Tax=Rhodopseudomonas sp. BR0M22 TaxID=2269369 RepID=UPI0013DFF0D7|nr:LysR family transcriptional regulator [Rhodopseudomonas sp. BR0M22]NEW91010.1 LysR family transcriptional regulator [Rhodopseudomonas sp. BR0M22]